MVNKTNFELDAPPSVNECRAPPSVISVYYRNYTMIVTQLVGIAPHKNSRRIE